MRVLEAAVAASTAVAAGAAEAVRRAEYEVVAAALQLGPATAAATGALADSVRDSAGLAASRAVAARAHLATAGLGAVAGSVDGEGPGATLGVPVAAAAYDLLLAATRDDGDPARPQPSPAALPVLSLLEWAASCGLVGAGPGALGGQAALAAAASHVASVTAHHDGLLPGSVRVLGVLVCLAAASPAGGPAGSDLVAAAVHLAEALPPGVVMVAFGGLRAYSAALAGILRVVESKLCSAVPGYIPVTTACLGVVSLVPGSAPGSLTAVGDGLEPGDTVQLTLTLMSSWGDAPEQARYTATCYNAGLVEVYGSDLVSCGAAPPAGPAVSAPPGVDPLSVSVAARVAALCTLGFTPEAPPATGRAVRKRHASVVLQHRQAYFGQLDLINALDNGETEKAGLRAAALKRESEAQRDSQLAKELLCAWLNPAQPTALIDTVHNLAARGPDFFSASCHLGSGGLLAV